MVQPPQVGWAVSERIKAGNAGISDSFHGIHGYLMSNFLISWFPDSYLLKLCNFYLCRRWLRRVETLKR
jgi:hypothetical protein